MRKYRLACSLFALAATPAMATPWVRGYVVTNYEPAWYFGGSVSFQKAGAFQPGTDCPKGTLSALNYQTIFKTPWRTAADIEAINHEKNASLYTIQMLQRRGLSYRGFREDIQTYVNPFAAPDPGMQEVTGKIAEGFDLDNNPKTGGFTSPDGEAGIDNAYYRAFGCAGAFRGDPYQAALSLRANDKMLEGLFTMVIRVSGNQSPENDNNAVLEIGYSPDHVAKGPGDSVLADYSFRLLKNGLYSKVGATVKDGIVETGKVAQLHAPRFSWFPSHSGDVDFHDGRIRLAPSQSNGQLAGLIGGYRDWRDLYAEDNFAQFGAAVEQRDHQDSIGMYYALKRNADGMRDPGTGQNMGISIAYRLKAVPAFVVDPDKPFPAAVPTPNVHFTMRMYREHRAAFLKGISTRSIQPLPAGSIEGSRDRLVKNPDGTWRAIEGEIAHVDPPDPPAAAVANLAN